MTLSNPSGTVVTPVIDPEADSATATIRDNDAATSIAIAVAEGSLSVDESAGTITFTVTRTGDAAGTQTVSYAIGGTVTAADLGGSLAGGTVSFAQGETTQTITLTLTDDQLDELDETVTVTLSNPSGTVVTPVIDPEADSATATIRDNDAATSIAIAVAEGSLSVDESAGTITFTVTRTGDAAGTQTVSYAIGGTVTAADLGGSLAGGTVSFAQGETTQTITLTLTDDQLDELDETVTVTLSNPSGTVVTPVIDPEADSATATIRDNDAATSIAIAVAEGSLSVDESAGTITFTVTRTGDAAGTQSVSYAIGGTVTAADLGGSLAGGTVSFAQGETTQTITLTLTDDRARRADETLTVTLSNPSGSVVTPVIDHRGDSATATILDNDAATSIAIAVAGAAAVDESAGTITFTVTRTGDAAGTQTVDTRSAGVEAADLGGSLAGGTVTFAQGETTKTITLILTDDQLDEVTRPYRDAVEPERHRGDAGIDHRGTRPRRPSSTTTPRPRSRSRSPTAPSTRAPAPSPSRSPAPATPRARRRSTTRSAAPSKAADLGGSLAGGTVTFAQGETTKTITLTVTDDAARRGRRDRHGDAVEPERQRVDAGIDTEADSATATILDNDAATSISIAAPRAACRSTRRRHHHLHGHPHRRRRGHADGRLRASGAVEAADLGGSLAGGTVTFAQGETTKTITLTVTDDAARRGRRDRHGDAVEPGGTGSTPVIDHRGRLGHDDHPRQRRRDLDLDRGRRGSLSVNESAGTITFTVTRTGDAEGTQTVNYALGGTVDGRRPQRQPGRRHGHLRRRARPPRPSRSSSPTMRSTRSTRPSP